MVRINYFIDLFRGEGDEVGKNRGGDGWRDGGRMVAGVDLQIVMLIH